MFPQFFEGHLAAEFFVHGHRYYTESTLGVRANYLNAWGLNVSWTQFYGGGSQNLLRDRDFIGANLSYAF